MHETPNEEKLRELVLYIAKRSGDDLAFGATKLNKLLFYCDFLSYATRGKSITGHEYQRLDHGPAPRNIMSVIKTLIAEGAIERLETAYRGKQIRIRTIPKRDPNLAVFSNEEIALVNEVLSDCSKKSGTALSKKSHQFLGWKLAAQNETIPYDVVFVGERRQPTVKEFEWAHSLKELARECLAREA